MKHEIPTPGIAIQESMSWLKMDNIQFARRLGISEDILAGLIKGTITISNEYANALESVTGSPAAYWKMLARKAKI